MFVREFTITEHGLCLWSLWGDKSFICEHIGSFSKNINAHTFAARGEMATKVKIKRVSVLARNKIDQYWLRPTSTPPEGKIDYLKLIFSAPPAFGAGSAAQKISPARDSPCGLLGQYFIKFRSVPNEKKAGTRYLWRLENNANKSYSN